MNNKYIKTVAIIMSILLAFICLIFAVRNDNQASMPKAMKKVITALWCIFGICILFFIALVFLAKSSATTWQVFSIVMPIAGVTFWGAIALSAIEYIRSKKEK